MAAVSCFPGKANLMQRMLRNGPGRALPALLVLGVLGMVATARPSLAQGSDEAWSPVTVVYTSDIKGHIEPCG